MNFPTFSAHVFFLPRVRTTGPGDNLTLLGMSSGFLTTKTPIGPEVTVSQEKRFYVYAITDGPEVLYVGKGSGDRAKVSAKKHGGTPAILERMDDEEYAYKREVHWVDELQPQNNIATPGGGPRSEPNPIPRAYRGKLTEAEWKRAQKEHKRFLAEIQEVGPRRYTARYLLTKMNEANCEELGVSKVDLNRLREVANGCWA